MRKNKHKKPPKTKQHLLLFFQPSTAKKLQKDTKNAFSALFCTKITTHFVSLGLMISLWMCPVIFADCMSSGSESDEDYVIWENACKKEGQRGHLRSDLVYQREKCCSISILYATGRDRWAVLSDSSVGHHCALEHTEPTIVLAKRIRERAVHFVTATDLRLTMKLTTSRSNNKAGRNIPIHS